jgi:hypothetical protein
MSGLIKCGLSISINTSLSIYLSTNTIEFYSAIRKNETMWFESNTLFNWENSFVRINAHRININHGDT